MALTQVRLARLPQAAVVRGDFELLSLAMPGRRWVSAPGAFCRLRRGENFGKVVVRIDGKD